MAVCEQRGDRRATGTGQTFDVAVVGGGSAGCVVAARLAERESLSVLLIEAGPDLRAEVPCGLRDGWTIVPTDEIDWGYASEAGRAGESRPLRRVKALGGTSWVTRYIVRGSSADYDEWASLGNPGWGFEELLPYLRRLESDLEFPDSAWHGNSGPLPVTRYPELELSEAAAAVLSAVQASGFTYVEDHNRPGAIGVGRMPRNSRAGERVTTADAYLPPRGTAPNLTIRCGTEVEKLLVQDNCVCGVVLVDGSLVETGHVILCGGTYGSPAILMRSGVGPAEHLRSVGIPVTVDLPGVGANLSDHSAVWVECGYRGPARDAPNLDVMATFHSRHAQASLAPDLMLWFADPAGDPPSFEINVVLLRPHARGSVRLRSKDPGDPLRIALPVAEESDVQRLADGLETAVEVARSAEVRRVCSDPPSPSLSQEELVDFVRFNAYSLPHVIGTCSMGPDPTTGAVVDATGAVHAVGRLTVADASLVPIAHSGFTQVVTIALAEKIAEGLAPTL